MLQREHQESLEAGDSDHSMGQWPTVDSGSFVLYVPGEATSFEPLLGHFRAAGMEFCRDADTVETRLRFVEDDRVVVVFANPVLDLVARLHAGEDLDHATAAWCSDTERMLAMVRKNRGRTILFDGHAAMCAPELLKLRLAERLPWIGENAMDSIRAELPQGGLKHLLASHALQRDDGASLLLSELEASSLALGPAFRIDLDAIPSDEGSSASAPELEKLGRENEYLLLQRQQLQEDFEACLRENQRLHDLGAATREIEQARASIESEFTQAREAWQRERDAFGAKLEAEVNRQAQRQRESLEKDHEAARKAWRQERKTLIEQLEADAENKVQLARNQAESEFGDAREAWRQETEQLKNDLEWTANDLDAMRRSLSWRLTAPLRQLLGLFTGGSRL